MPHLKIEVSKDLKPEAEALAQAMHQAAGTCPDIDLDRVKTRVTAFNTFLIGGGSTFRDFIHVEFAILSGRDAETKKSYTAILSDCVRDFCAKRKLSGVSITVEVRDMDRGSYFRN